MALAHRGVKCEARGKAHSAVPASPPPSIFIIELQNTPDVARFHRPRVSTPSVPFPWDQVCGIYVTSHAGRKMVLPCVQSDTALNNNCGILVPATAFAHGAQTKMARN